MSMAVTAAVGTFVSAHAVGIGVTAVVAGAGYSAYSSYEQAKAAEKEAKKAEKIGALFGANSKYAQGLEMRRRKLLEPTKAAGLTLGNELKNNIDGSRISGGLNNSIMPHLGIANAATKLRATGSGARVGGARDISETGRIGSAFAESKAIQSAGLGAMVRSDNTNRKLNIIKAGQQTTEMK